MLRGVLLGCGEREQSAAHGGLTRTSRGFSRGYNLEGCPWRRRAGVPVGTVALTGVDEAAGPGTGIMVGGVPIGEPARL